MRVRFHTTINKDLLTAIKVKAAKENKKVNDILEELIEDNLNKEDKNECNTKE